jgi:eukaryotic-like serine/threonine-protein kinase
MFRHDAARSGRAEGTAPTLAGVEWSVDLGGPVDSSPAVAQGAVFVGTAAGGACAVDAATGSRKWTTPLPGPLVASPAIAQGRVVFGCADGYLYALDASTGHEAWRFRTGRSVVGPPLVIGDRVLCGSTDGGLYALSSADGSLLWRTDAGGEIQAGPAATADVVVYADWDRHVRCVRAQDGSPVWAEPYLTDGPVVACPVIESSYALVSSLAPTGIQPPPALVVNCVDLASGKRVWGAPGTNPWATERERGSMSLSTCATVANGVIWFVTGESYGNWSAMVRAAALPTGARVGVVPQSAARQGWAPTDSCAALAENQLYWADYSATLHQVDTATGRAVKALPLGAKTRSSPAISDGRLYIGLTDGKLLCIR